MASPLFSIPRFLLPRSGQIWRRPNLGDGLRHLELRVVCRNASTSPAKKVKTQQIVLEKPAKFNPPSHGARLPTGNRPRQQHYGGVMSAEEIVAQKMKDYPGLPPPQGSFGHKFLNNRYLHTILPISVLISLVIYADYEKFKANSPYADMLPTWSDFFRSPIDTINLIWEVNDLDSVYQAEQTAAERKKETDDMAKREAYRNAHGKESAFFSVKKDEPLEPEVPQKREKFLGIF